AEKVPACMAAAIECAPGELEELRTQLNALRGRLFKNAA
ncbi:MarR family transcriptional regulator, partial [Escherichia coli]|nr:MarR family transcriptional regulator [Escherichia coli]